LPIRNTCGERDDFVVSRLAAHHKP
jgi:hypothetical protein